MKKGAEAEGEQEAARTDSDADRTNRGEEKSQEPKASRRLLEPTATMTVRTAAIKRAKGTKWSSRLLEPIATLTAGLIAARKGARGRRQAAVRSNQQ